MWPQRINMYYVLGSCIWRNVERTLRTRSEGKKGLYGEIVLTHHDGCVRPKTSPRNWIYF